MTASRTSRPTVMLVCDSEVNARVLRRHAQSLPVDVVETADCLAAIELAGNQELALILVDLQQPMMDGLEAVRVLRATPRTAHVPLIIVADTRVGLAERQRGVSLGSVAFVHRLESDFDQLREQMRLILAMHLQAATVQRQIHLFLDEHARIAEANPQIAAMTPSLHRHLLLDLLTGLPNRMFFELHLLALMRRNARGGAGFALAWLDVDHLPRINQRHRRSTGDRLLTAIAQRLETGVRSSDILARIGGDTYGVVLDGVVDEAGAKTAVGKLLKAVGEPLDSLDAQGAPLTLVPTLSVGVALYPRHGEDLTELYHVSRLAAAEVLRQGGDGVRVGWSSPGGRRSGDTT